MLQTAAETKPESSPQLRVILVGRTGLEHRVRQEPGIELVRTRSALDAIGENGLSLAEAPERTLVVLSDDQARSDDAAELIRALRRVKPGVKVAAMRSGLGDEGPRAATDAMINDDADGAALLELMDQLDGRHRNGHQLSTPTVAIELDEPPVRSAGGAATVAEAVAVASGSPAPTVSPTPAMVTQPRLEPSDSDVTADAVHADVALVHVLLAGGDIMPLCIERVQVADARGPVVFHPGGKAVASPLAPEGFGVETVSHRDTVFGWLVGPLTDEAQSSLRRRAVWLGHWLALREQHRQLCTAAFTDALTGAWNRRYFERFLDGAIKEAQRKRQVLTVLVFDIDDFKRYNDEYGHPVGDEILTETVRLLRSVVRPHDKVCRIGGDEFAVVFYEPDGPREAGSQHPAEISQIARRFQAQIAAARFPKLGAEFKGRLTISGGLATYPWDGHTADSLLAKADALSLESKRQGKNVICFGPATSEDGMSGAWQG